MIPFHPDIDGIPQRCNPLHLDSVLEQEMKASAKTGSPLSVLIFDLDHFKMVNDDFGHQAGDNVLRRTAEILKSLVPVGFVGRWGGEEFLAVLPGAGEEEATEFGERILEHAQRLLEETEAVHALAQHRQATPQGTLRVSLPPGFLDELDLVPFVVEFADGRAESPGESQSRLRMWELSLPAPELQVPIMTDDGVKRPGPWEIRSASGSAAEGSGRNLLHPPRHLGRGPPRERQEEDALGIGAGRFELSGSIEAYFEDIELYEAFLNGDATALAFTLGSTAGEKYTFTIPNIKFETGTVQAQGNDSDIMASMTYRGLYDSVNGCTLMIERGVA